METLLGFLLELVRNPVMISIFCYCFIGFYYLVSFFFIREAQNPTANSIWKKKGFFDVATSAIWIFVSLMTICSLFELASKKELTLDYLIQYYFFFIFIFAFTYGILEWHFAGMIQGLDSTISWKSEVKYIILSIQTQTTLGYTRVKPSSLITELISCAQALLGLFFCIIFIAKAINAISQIHTY